MSVRQQVEEVEAVSSQAPPMTPPTVKVDDDEVLAGEVRWAQEVTAYRTREAR